MPPQNRQIIRMLLHAQMHAIAATMHEDVHV